MGSPQKRRLAVLAAAAVIAVIPIQSEGQNCGSALLSERALPAAFQGISLGASTVTRMWAAGNGAQYFNGNACLAGCRSFSSSPLCNGNGHCIAITGVNWINTVCAPAGIRPARTVLVVESPTVSSGGVWAALNLNSNDNDSNYDLDFMQAGASSIASPYIGGLGQPIAVLAAHITGSMLTLTISWTAPSAAAEALNNSGASLVRSYSVFFARSTGGVPPSSTGSKAGWTQVNDTDSTSLAGYSADTSATVVINLSGSPERLFVAVGLNLDGSGNPGGDPNTKESAHISQFTEVCVLASPPAAPALTAPAAAVSGTLYLVNWTATSADNTYEVQESADSGFAGASTTPVAGTSAGFSHTVASDTTYYYRVRAKVMCSGSPYFSEWSPGGSTLVIAGARFYPVTPCRVVDTRSSIDPQEVKRGNFADGETRAYTFSQSADCPGLPADTKAWSINTQIRPIVGQSALTAYPHGMSRPGTTTILGFEARWRVNNAIVAAGSGGTFDVYCDYASRVIFDVNGYFK